MADKLHFLLSCIISLISMFYIGRALYRRNSVGATYLFGLFCLWGAAAFTAVMARAEDNSPLLCFLAYLFVFFLFVMLVAWRVRDTGRKVRGLLAVIVWLLGGLALHLFALLERMHWENPFSSTPDLPPWAFGSGIGVLMLGSILASLQLRDAETYFN